VKKKNIAMVAVLLLALMAIPFWGLFAQPGGVAPGGSDDMVIYTFMLDGGHVYGNFEDVIITRQGGEHFNLPVPERDGSVFTGWTQVASVVNDEFMYAGGGSFTSKLYIAMWSQAYVPAYLPFEATVGYIPEQPFYGGYTPSMPYSGGYVPFVPSGGYIPFVPASPFDATFNLIGGGVDMGGWITPVDAVWNLIGMSTLPVDVSDWEFGTITTPAAPVLTGAPQNPFDFIFEGWASGSALSADIIPPGAAVIIGGDTQFYARWVPNPNPQPTISFNMGTGTYDHLAAGFPSSTWAPFPSVPMGNGGTVAAGQIPDVANLNNTTPGYGAFLHWALTPGGASVDPTQHPIAAVPGNTTFYAVWDTFGPVTVIFSFGAGSDGTGRSIATTDIASGESLSDAISAVVPPLPTPAVYIPPSGFYEFSHWATGSALNAPMTPLNTPINSTTTFHAIWTPAVTFNFSGATVTSVLEPAARVPVAYGGNLMAGQLPNMTIFDTPAFDIANFLGWATTSGATVPDVPDPLLVTINGPTTFFAVWDTQAPHTVTFDLSGGVHPPPILGGPHMFSVNIGDPIPLAELPDANFMSHVTFNHFSHWTVSPSALVADFPTTADIVAYFTSVTSDLTFTAVWVHQHPVTFNLNGGNVGGNPANVIEMITENTAITAGDVPAAVRFPENLVGWTPSDPVGQMVTGPIEFVAQWSNTYFPITFNPGTALGGLAGALLPTALTTPSALDAGNVILYLPAGAELLPGQLPTFANVLPPGWSYTWQMVVNPGFTGSLNDLNQGVGGITPWGPATFTAVFYIPVEFDLNGGSVAGGGSGPSTISLQVLEAFAGNTIASIPGLNVPVLEAARADGAQFAGWLRDANLVSPAALYTTSGDVADINIVPAHWHFVAQWNFAGVYIDVTFNLSGGTYPGHVNGQVFRPGLQADEEIPVALVPMPASLVRPDFLFSHWVMGNGTTPVTPSALSPAALLTTDTTFTAVWTPDPASVVGNFFATFDFDAGYATGFGYGPAVLGPFASGSAITTIPAPEKDNHILSGWVLDDGINPPQNISHAALPSMTFDTDVTLTAIWVPFGPIFGATFNLAGGTFNGSLGPVISGPFAQGSQIPLSEVPVPVRPDFLFAHWVRTGDASMAPVTPSSLTPAAISDEYFTAVWTPDPASSPGNFFATFELDGGEYGSFGMGPIVVGPFVSGSAITAIPTPTRASHTLSHWLVDDGAVPPQIIHPDDLPAMTFDDDITFIALWIPASEAGQFTATFNLAGGVCPFFNEGILGTVTRGPFNIGGQIPVGDVPAPDRPSFEFLGWVIDGDASETFVTPSALATPPGADITFTARWGLVTPNTFLILFNLDGGTYLGYGTGPVDRGPFVVGTPTQLNIADIPLPTRTGYTFEGWLRDGIVGGTPVSRAALADESFDDAASFTAVWEPRGQFDVIFFFASGNVSGDTGPAHRGPYYVGDTIPLADVPEPERLNYTFLHWIRGGTNAVVPSPSALAASEFTAGIHTFTAVWERDDTDGYFRARFYLAGGSYSTYGPGPVDVWFAEGDQIPSAPTPTRFGWTFVHWLDAEGNIVADPTDLVAPTGNVSFVAVWQPLDDTPPGYFMAMFNLNGGMFEDSTNAVPRGPFAVGTQIPAASVPTPTRSGYEFMHWVIAGSNTPVTPSALNPARNADVFFTAMWNPTGVPPIQHAITFNFDGGTSATHLPAAGPVTVQINQGAAITQPNVPFVTRGADQFLGWRQEGTQSTLTREQVANHNVVVPTSFTAIWRTPDEPGPTEFYATFILAGGVYASSTGNVVVGPFAVNTQIPAGDVPAPTRTGFTFEGWLLNNVTVTPSALTTAPIADITFVAAWEPVPVAGNFFATFVLNGGTYGDFGFGPIVEGPFADGTQIPASVVPAPVRPGFTFQHWVITGSDTIVNPASLTPAPTGNVSFTAIWQAVAIPGHFIATFHLAGGTYGIYGAGPVVVPAILNNTQIPANRVPNPVRAGYTFQYWVLTGYGTPVTPSALNPARSSDVHFTAVWEGEAYVTTQHAVRFYFAGGTSSTHNPPLGPVEIMINHGAAITAANVPALTRTGYDLLGWQQRSMAPNVQPPANVANIVVAGPMVFDAAWDQTPIDTNYFTATFILAGGVFENSTGNVVVGPFAVGTQIPLASVPAPTRVGFNFVGWTLNGAPVNPSNLTPAPAGNVTFVAVWEPVSVDGHFFATFILAGGTYSIYGTGPVVQGPFANGTQIPANYIPTPVRSGFTFEHWVITGTNIAVDPSQIIPAPVANVSFTAVWDVESVPGHYRVIFRPGALAGATLTAGTQGVVLSGEVIFYVPAGTAITAANIPTLNLPQAQAFWLYEWALTSGTTAGTAGNDNVTGLIPTGQVVFTAEYFMEVSVGDLPPVRVPMGDVEDTTVGDIISDVDTTNPDNPADEFRGWIRRDRDGNNITTNDRGFYTSDELAEMELDPSEYWNFDLVWRSGTFYATFIFNGGVLASFEGSHIVRGPLLSGELIPAALVPTLTREGHTFQHWVRTGTNDILVPSAQRPTADISFTAVWDGGAVTHPVRFYFTGGTSATHTPAAGPVQVTINHNTAITPANVPTVTRAGYDFLGWQQRAEGAYVESPADVAATVVTEPLEFEAVWRARDNTFIATFILAGGVFENSTGNVEAGPFAVGTQIPAASVPTPTRTNFTFMHWTLGGAVVDPTNLTPAPTADVTFVAVWQPAQVAGHFFATFNLAGGTFGAFGTGPVIQGPFANGTQIPAGQVPTPTRAGHNFVHWVLTNTTTQVNPSNLNPAPVADISFTAVWAPVVTGQHAVRFYFNGGTSTTHTPAAGPIAAMINHNASITLGNVPFVTRTGYNFLGWQQVGAGTNHITREAVAGITVTAPVSFRAEWAPVAPAVITVTFSPGIGTLPPGVPAVRQGSFGFRVDNFPTPIPPAGYTFVGWYMHGVRQVEAFAATANVTLFAHYQRTQVGPRNYTITFVLNHGTMPPNSQTTQIHPYGTHINTLPVPTRAGHVFVGWMHGNTIQPMPFILRGNMTLTAAWALTPQPSPTPQPTIPPTHLVVAFDPSPGAFPAGESGIRTGVYGFVVNTMPTPTRAGYVFAGWSIGTTHINLPLTVRQDTTVTARWTPRHGTIVNPQTSPIQVTFTIFGAVLLVGIAAFGIMKLTGKQLAALGQYRTSMTRYNREKRITDMFEKRDPKDKK